MVFGAPCDHGVVALCDLAAPSLNGVPASEIFRTSMKAAPGGGAAGVSLRAVSDDLGTKL
jgi:hypothetical protein